MHQLLYASSTSRDIVDSELQSILTTARRNNQLKGVTGLLLHIDGGFMQVLEGEEPALIELYGQIAKDKRHWDAHVILSRQATRIFADWSMGFRKLSSNNQSDAAAFQITKSAIQHRVKANQAPEVMVMLSTFYRVQSGEIEIPA